MIIGITGNFGSGKTTFCKYLQKLGAFFINSDEIVHDFYKPGKIGFKKIRVCFGLEFIDERKGVLRDKLRDVVLKNPKKLIILNKLIHPLVLREAKKLIKGRNELICIESFYFEKDFLGSLVDKVILIERKPNLIKIARRGKWKIADINRFLKLQSIYPKPDFVVKNNGSLKLLKKKAIEVYKEFQIQKSK